MGRKIDQTPLDGEDYWNDLADEIEHDSPRQHIRSTPLDMKAPVKQTPRQSCLPEGAQKLLDLVISAKLGEPVNTLESLPQREPDLVIVMSRQRNRSSRAIPRRIQNPKFC